MSGQYSAIPPYVIEVQDIKTAFRSMGTPNGRPLVLLHGMSNSSDVYREVMHELAAERWLIAPDLPGHGLSGVAQPYTLTHLVAWLGDFTAALGIREMDLLGHSFGGALATAYAAAHPRQIARLLLVAPAVLAGTLFPDIVKRAGISSGLVDLSGALSQSTFFEEQQFARPFHDASQLPQGLRTRFLEARQQARATADVLKALAFEDLSPQVRGLQMPVRVVWGANDPVLPVAQAAKVEELLPDGRLEIWDATGHLPFVENQERFIDLAREFLNSAATTVSAPVVSVFGSSAPRPDSQAYATAREVGRLLAEAGFAVATGGYSGTMAAVSQGAAEAGGQVIGVTSDQIEQFRPMGPNKWVNHEVRYPSLRERLNHLVVDNEGIIVLPGGIGTLSEMALAWSLLQVGEMPPRPIALLGNQWRNTIQAFVDDQYVRPEHLALLRLAATPQEAIDQMSTFQRPA